MKIEHYAQYYFPGALMEESCATPLESGTEEEAIAKAPNGAFAFSLREVTVRKGVLEDGQEIEDRTMVKRSGRVYLGGTVMTAAQVSSDKPGSILESNMRSNKWSHVIRARYGNVQPFDPNTDKVVTV